MILIDKKGNIRRCNYCGVGLTTEIASKATSPPHKQYYANICLPCNTKKAKAWYVENKNKKREYDKKYSAKRGRAYYKKISKKWRNNNPSKKALDTGKRRAKIKQATPKWANHEEMNKYYMMSREFGLQVDHIVPIQGDGVCGLHCEDNLQLLPPAENARKNNHYEHYFKIH